LYSLAIVERPSPDPAFSSTENDSAICVPKEVVVLGFWLTEDPFARVT
jgi:hypothetical protein